MGHNSFPMAHNRGSANACDRRNKWTQDRKSQIPTSHPALGQVRSLRAQRNHGRIGSTLNTLHCDASFTCFSSLLGRKRHEGRGCVCLTHLKLQQSHNTANSIDFCWRNEWMARDSNFRFWFPPTVITHWTQGQITNSAVQPALHHPFSWVLLRAKENCAELVGLSLLSWRLPGNLSESHSRPSTKGASEENVDLPQAGMSNRNNSPLPPTPDVLGIVPTSSNFLIQTTSLEKTGK